MKKILIIDDDLGLLEVMESVLTHQGFSVVTSMPQEDIQSLVMLNQPDLVILDYLMNDVNGGELCSRLKKDVVTKHIPVIILSAYDRVIGSLGNYGCDLLIAKPFDFLSLVSQIKGLLALHPENSACNS